MGSSREIVVFIPNENADPPLKIGRDLVALLKAGEPVFGVDAFTGAVEVRLIYSEETLRRARNFLIERRVVFDMSLM